MNLREIEELTDILDVVEHVETEHEEEAGDVEDIPGSQPRGQVLVDPLPDPELEAPGGVEDPGGEGVAATVLAEVAVVPLRHVLVQLVLHLADPLAHMDHLVVHLLRLVARF